MATAVKALDKNLKASGPQTDDELHKWILDNIGINVPRVAVCNDADPPHAAPFDFLADLYFQRTNSALAMANRGGAKTFLVALLHYINSLYKPGIESCTFGAVENQSDRAYGHLLQWIRHDDGEYKGEIVYSKRKETRFKNGSKIEVLGSTPEQVNGPHPQVAHADEIELMRDDTWSESRGMPIAKIAKNGQTYIAQNVLTSTRKGPMGRMQELIDEIKSAELQDLIPPYKFYAWCIKEVVAQVPNCREAPENADLPEDQKCQCHKYKQGFWDDGKDRFLNQVCGGDFHKSRGWKPYTDITEAFMQNSRAVWEAQHECKKALTENMILPQFSDVKNIIKNFVPNPKNGSIYMAVDWGGTAPNAVNWYQLITHPVTAINNADKEIIIPANSLICFDEIYLEDIPPTKLGSMVHAKEDEYRDMLGKDFRIDYRFPDPHGSGRMARNEWARMSRPLFTHFMSSHNFEIQVTYLHELLDDGRFFVLGNKCPNFVSEALSWRRDPKTNNEVREFNHAMSNFRYAVANIRHVNSRILLRRIETEELPVDASSFTYDDSPVPIAVRQKEREEQGEAWRQRFFTTQPIQKPGFFDR